jgi:hypothetical protein
MKEKYRNFNKKWCTETCELKMEIYNMRGWRTEEEYIARLKQSKKLN